MREDSRRGQRPGIDAPRSARGGEVGVVEVAEGLVAEGGGAAGAVVGEEVLAGGTGDGLHGGSGWISGAMG